MEVSLLESEFLHQREYLRQKALISRARALTSIDKLAKSEHLHRAVFE
jgi:hypothetical protein